MSILHHNWGFSLNVLALFSVWKRWTQKIPTPKTSGFHHKHSKFGKKTHTWEKEDFLYFFLAKENNVYCCCYCWISPEGTSEIPKLEFYFSYLLYFSKIRTWWLSLLACLVSQSDNLASSCFNSWTSLPVQAGNTDWPVVLSWSPNPIFPDTFTFYFIFIRLHSINNWPPPICWSDLSSRFPHWI